VEIIPDKRRVVGLIEQAHEGKICLPNFQRDFVCMRAEVASMRSSMSPTATKLGAMVRRC
jgi:hypothetical protein